MRTFFLLKEKNLSEICLKNLLKLTYIADFLEITRSKRVCYQTLLMKKLIFKISFFPYKWVIFSFFSLFFEKLIKLNNGKFGKKCGHGLLSRVILVPNLPINLKNLTRTRR